MNDIMNYAMYIYPAKTRDEIQWNVEFPEVFGVGGAGNTPEEAINDAQENLKIHLKFLTDENLEKTPNLRILKDIINNMIEDFYDKLNTYIRDLQADHDYIDDFDYGYNCALDKLVSFIEQLKQYSINDNFIKKSNLLFFEDLNKKSIFILNKNELNNYSIIEDIWTGYEINYNDPIHIHIITKSGLKTPSFLCFDTKQEAENKLSQLKYLKIITDEVNND